MSRLILAVGTVVLGLAVVDLLWTTLWVEGGAGPLTARLMAGTWAVIRKVARPNSRLLSLSGPILLVLTLSLWIALLWLGWLLVFSSGPFSLIDTVGTGPITWVDRLYFVGYTVFTLGNGDLVPRDGRWQIATTLATASGMLFVTLSVSYILSVLDAVTQKRAFASGVTGLGMHPTDVLRNSWNGEAFEGLDLPISASTSQLNTLASNHKAYPLLHYFHSSKSEQAPVVAITILDEVLTLFSHGIPEQDHPRDPILANARASVDNYLEILRSAFIEPADRTPPSPALAPLRASGIPTVDDGAFEQSLTEVTDRRRALLGLVESDRRQWPATDDSDTDH